MRIFKKRATIILQILNRYFSKICL